MHDAAPLAQLVERRSHNPEVVSSILTGSMQDCIKFYSFHPVTTRLSLVVTKKGLF